MPVAQLVKTPEGGGRLPALCPAAGSRSVYRNQVRMVPAKTLAAYDSAWGQFAAWCTGYGQVPLPAAPQTLTGYVSALIALGLAPGTVAQAVGAIRSRHRRAGYRDQPDTGGALLLLRAYRRDWESAGNQVRRAVPLSPDALRALVGTCDPATLIGIRDRAMLLLGFAIMGRRSEICGLDIPDVRMAGEQGIEVDVTRPRAGRVTVPVAYGQHAETCPVRAVRAWAGILAGRGITAGPLFRPVDRHGRTGGEPRTAGKPAIRYTPQNFNKMVKARARLAGLPDADRYSAHSIRSGAAASAYAAGVQVAGSGFHPLAVAACDAGAVPGGFPVSKYEARSRLREYRQRDQIVLDALDAGLTRTEIHNESGLSRVTINKIIASAYGDSAVEEFAT